MHKVTLVRRRKLPVAGFLLSRRASFLLPRLSLRYSCPCRIVSDHIAPCILDAMASPEVVRECVRVRAHLTARGD